ncbi:DUF4241 domain-containing protein [Actinokineospora sp. G85]|uniref:DUF4241 domain-containing protein n=1 Tax=Actinokineospora sp. G85 TaxID=3406626 RepID=UPI003C78483B
MTKSLTAVYREGRDPGTGEVVSEMIPAGVVRLPSGRVAAARLVVSPDPVTTWEQALRPGDDRLPLSGDQFHGFGVDTGLACFADAGAYPVWLGRTAAGAVACFVADFLVLHGAALG